MSSGSPVNASALASATDALAASRAFCAKITAAKARNFYYGVMLTPRDKRAAMYAIYTWMRAVDDLADDDAPPSAQGGDDETDFPAATNARHPTTHSPTDLDARRRRLEAVRRQTHAALRDGSAWLDSPLGEHDPYAAMWPAVAHALREHRVPPAYLDAVIDGQLIDLARTRYDTFARLYDYCYNVASAVGLTCIEVWGYTGGDATRKLAEERGVALQLTNILRDLVEDARRDRVYLPADELARFGFDAESFKRFLLGEPEPRNAGDFDALMRFQLQRARGYYDRTAALESFVTRACRPTCWAMMKIYEALLRRIERDPRTVLTRRVKLGTLHKLAIAARATLRRGLRG